MSSCNDREQVYLSISRVLLVLVALGVWTGARPAGAADGPSGVTCAACVAMDSTGRVLWARAPSAARPNASTTKMVTALVALGATEPGDVVQVSATAASVDGGGLDLDPGDVYTVRDLLHALLLTSSNEAASALAEHVSGSQEAFVARMNRIAGSVRRAPTSSTPTGSMPPVTSRRRRTSLGSLLPSWTSPFWPASSPRSGLPSPHPPGLRSSRTVTPYSTVTRERSGSRRDGRSGPATCW